MRRIYGCPFPPHPTPPVYSCFICECKWNFRLEILLNDFPHFWHTWGFSPVWISTWFLRFPFWWNPLPQTLQTKSFSSVCIFMWVFSVEERLNALLQCVHLCGLSAVWMILCRHSVDERRNPGRNVLWELVWRIWDEEIEIYLSYYGEFETKIWKKIPYGELWNLSCKIAKYFYKRVIKENYGMWDEKLQNVPIRDIMENYGNRGDDCKNIPKKVSLFPMNK